MSQGIEVAGGTLKGNAQSRRRAASATDRHLGWFAVADGMGQHPGQDVASKKALEIVRGCFYTPGRTWRNGVLVNPERMRAHLFSSLMFANLMLREETGDQTLDPCPATTFLGIVVRAGKLWVSHIGDGRCYRFRGGRLERLTTDHSVRDDAHGRERLPAGVAERMASDDLTRALGLHAAAMSDVHDTDAEAGNIVILTTRGLTEVIDDATLGNVFSVDQDIETATAKLLDCARKRGGANSAEALVVRY